MEHENENKNLGMKFKDTKVYKGKFDADIALDLRSKACELKLPEIFTFINLNGKSFTDELDINLVYEEYELEEYFHQLHQYKKKIIFKKIFSKPIFFYNTVKIKKRYHTFDGVKIILFVGFFKIIGNTEIDNTEIKIYYKGVKILTCSPEYCYYVNFDNIHLWGKEVLYIHRTMNETLTGIYRKKKLHIEQIGLI